MANIYFRCKWTKGELDFHVTRFPFQDNSQTWQQAHYMLMFWIRIQYAHEMKKIFKQNYMISWIFYHHLIKIVLHMYSFLWNLELVRVQTNQVSHIKRWCVKKKHL
jgi:hypothetical protein